MPAGTSTSESPPLHDVFAPTSIAVIGASNHVTSVGGMLFRNILQAGYRGVVYPVNPSWKSVSGVRCYASVADLPEAPELGVVIVPAPLVSGVVAQLGEAGTRAAVVISAGFREIGGAGVGREEALIATAKKYGISIVGPNCFGVINTAPEVSLNATFSEDLPPRGNIAFVSQSGALCAGILRYGISERIGFSRFVSVGNRAGVEESDILRSLGTDPHTHVILLYIESLANERRFLDAAREVSKRKPILVIKSGRSPEGERAARSHTGSLAHAAQDRLYDALFEQAGVLRADTIGELFREAKVFSTGARLDGSRIAILTNSGGPGIVAADACSRSGLALPALSERTQARLRARLSPSAATGNPVDTTADVSVRQFGAALKELIGVPTLDGCLVIATPVGELQAPALSQLILNARGRIKKPVVACVFGLVDLTQEVRTLEDHGIPSFTFPEEAVVALSSLAHYQRRLDRPVRRFRPYPVDHAAVRRLMHRVPPAESTILPEFSARALLSAYGVPFAPAHLAKTPEEAVRFADRTGYPVVLKVASPDISHKTDVGGVRVGVASAQELRAAWTEVRATVTQKAPTARIEGFEIEKMITGGKEVLIGLQRDPRFGPVIVFGLGGIYVEVLKDVTFRLAPFDRTEAEEMVASVRAFPLLQGVRGEKPSDLSALYTILGRVAQLALDLPQVQELDLNPVIVQSVGEGAFAVDARLVLGPTGPTSRS
ncbi:MAG TPA: acetate--CoA ligase family protein, partial [Thermoplasmata archaeon]|nr:acetate--CoA ligase family protein [Thermoplasmata archaeon]